MKVAVVGATGRTGIQFIYKAVSKDHSVVALVRSLSRIPVELKNHPLVQVVQGDIYSDAAANTLFLDVDAVLIATSGSNPIEPTSIVQDSVLFVQKALDLNKAFKLSQIVLISSDGVSGDISARPFFYRKVLHPYVLHNAYADLEVAEANIKAISKSYPRVKYTILQPPQILEMDPVNDLVLFETDSFFDKSVYSGQITYKDLGGKILEILVGKMFLNKSMGIESPTVLAHPLDKRGSAREALYKALVKYSPRLLVASAVVVGFGITLARFIRQ